MSYRVALTADGLLAVLTTGILQTVDVATFLHFLEEAPLSIIVIAIEQSAQQCGVAISQNRSNVDQIAAALSSTRLRSMGA